MPVLARHSRRSLLITPVTPGSRVWRNRNIGLEMKQVFSYRIFRGTLELSDVVGTQQRDVDRIDDEACCEEQQNVERDLIQHEYQFKHSSNEDIGNQAPLADEEERSPIESSQAGQE